MVTGVVLGDVNDDETKCDSDESCECEVQPVNSLKVTEHEIGGHEECDNDQCNSDVVTEVEGLDDICILVGQADTEDSDEGSDESECDKDQGEEDEIDQEVSGDQVEDCETDDHCTDDLCCGGLEDVCSTSCTVSDVVSDKVCDDCGVPGVILGDSSLDLSDEICTDICCLGVDPSSELCEQCCHGCTECVSDDRVEGGGHGLVTPDVVDVEDEEETCEGEERNCDTGDCSSAEGGLECCVKGSACCGCGPDVGVDRDLHSDESGKDGECCSDDECDCDFVVEVILEALGQESDDCDDHGDDDCDDTDRLVLLAEVCHCTLLDLIGNRLHLRSSLVQREDLLVEDESDCQSKYRCEGHHKQQVVHSELDHVFLLLKVVSVG